MGGFNMQRFHEAGQAFEIDPVCEMKVDPQAVIATIPSREAPNGISFSTLPPSLLLRLKYNLKYQKADRWICQE